MKLGIALAGGGVRGAAHLGILQALEENGIVADMYAGTSAGAIVATLKSLGKSNQEIVEYLHKIDIKLMDVAFGDILFSLPKRLKNLEAVLKGDKLHGFLEDVTGGKNMGHLTMPLSIISTDINTGCQVIFSTETMEDEKLHRLDNNIKLIHRPHLPLSEIVYTSCTLPGIFKPLTYGEMKLVDGSITNNLPANVLHAQGADKIIAIDLTMRNRRKRTKGMFDVLGQAINILIEQNINMSMDYAGEAIYLNPEIRDIGLLEVHRSLECFYTGYRYGKNIAPYVIGKLEESK